MKRFWLAVCGIVLSGALIVPAMAAEDVPRPSAAGTQAQGGNGVSQRGAKPESEAAKRHRQAVQQRDALKTRRDAGMKLRAQHVANDDPGPATIQPGR